MRTTFPARFAFGGLIAVALGVTLGARQLDPPSSDPAGRELGCLACHQGIEEMHPEASLSCVDCHGGNGAATTKEEAHVKRPAAEAGDERVVPLDRDLPWVQFQNPMDLRVARKICGDCHEQSVDHLLASLHGTTAGHLSDGYYEMGLFPERGSRYSVFPQADAPLPGGEVDRLVQPPPFQERLPRDQLSTHYTDLARKECMQCHLWSPGRAVRGRVGFDGDYRGSGCAACHVLYELDGLSRSADRAAVRTEPGHPGMHRMSRAPTTDTCTSCHYGDASIGLHFRGLSQLPPTAPGGPEIPGTTARQLNRVFYLNDPAIVPPDVHHERGMHCIDCHTQDDVMGDGRMHGQMEHAVEISCSGCHGTFEAIASLQTERGRPLSNLSWDGTEVVLTSKVDGKTHRVPQVVHVLDPSHPAFNAQAARAMTPQHGKVECYTCHASWNVNLLGFHFSRQEQLTQLDLLTGKRTPGRVTTQEKVFATWKSFYAGLNERGSVAPYLTGFSTMGSVWDEQGQLIIDQALPVTARGLSGMTMIHHQPHSTRSTARACVECHRAPGTWGLGSPNFQLARQLAFIADRRGIEVAALDRSNLSASALLTKFPLPDVVALGVQVDPLQGHAEYLFVAEGGRGIHVLDVHDPAQPRRIAFAACVNPRGLQLAGGLLYVADGIGGLKIFDVSVPEAIHEVGRLPTFDAHDVEVHWPWAYVADGPAGLSIVDVRAPIAPRYLSTVDLNGESRLLNEAILVDTLFQYSRPMAKDGAPVDQRTQARNLCAVLDRRQGFFLIDVTEPELPQLLFPSAERRTRARAASGVLYRGMSLLSQVDLAEPQGGERTAERDYLYVLSERQGDTRRSFVNAFDVSDPLNVPPGRNRVNGGYASEQLTLADFYSPPLCRRIALVPGERGVYLADFTTAREPTLLGLLPGVEESYAVAVERFPLDKMLEDDGRPLKDTSHEPSRWLWRSEIERILGVSKEELGTDLVYSRSLDGPGQTVLLHLAALDTDRSGLLEGEEYAQGGGAAVDEDGDGRISLIELARASRALGADPASTGSGDGQPLAVSRVSADGDLAKLLDGVNPYEYQRGKNGLSRSEVERAFFDALDLNDDRSLSLDELSRYPGAPRDLRYRDEAARQRFREVDRSGDGEVSLREFHLGDSEWEALDSDRDQVVWLVAPTLDCQRKRGFVMPGSEWPSRRTELRLLPPGFNADQLLAALDHDGNEVLDAREMKKRDDLVGLFDKDGDRRIERLELERGVPVVGLGGVDVLADDFRGRWDLNGSGVVEAGELPEGARLRLKLR